MLATGWRHLRRAIGRCQFEGSCYPASSLLALNIPPRDTQPRSIRFGKVSISKDVKSRTYCTMRRAQAEAAAVTTAKSARDLLPANVIPRHYDVTIEPDLDKFTFEGKVAIDLD